MMSNNVVFLLTYFVRSVTIIKIVDVYVAVLSFKEFF